MGSDSSKSSTVSNLSASKVIQQVATTKQQLLSSLQDLEDSDTVFCAIRKGKCCLHDPLTRDKHKKRMVKAGKTAVYSGVGSVLIVPPFAVVGLPIALTSASVAASEFWYIMKTFHEYIVIEYGKKLQEPINGFQYKRFLRIDFGSDGYGIAMGSTSQYWDIYENEKNVKAGQLTAAVGCIAEVKSLIDIIIKHNAKYNVATNNCKDFSKKIWGKMKI
eukprot:1637_1